MSAPSPRCSGAASCAPRIPRSTRSSSPASGLSPCRRPSSLRRWCSGWSCREVSEMRVLIWIVEDTWKATVAAAAAFLPADAEVTLLYVTDSEAEIVTRGARHALLGRQAASEGRRGHVKREVVAAAEEMDLLVLARDGDHTHSGPRSLGPTARYVVDHASCAVLLVWPDSGSG